MIRFTTTLMFCLSLSACANLGISSGTTASVLEVPQYDVFAWQASREQELLADYQAAEHGVANPYVALDPYEMNPLSALVLFDTSDAASVNVRVLGIGGAPDYVYATGLVAKHHEVPILGLFPGVANQVELTLTGAGSRSTVSLKIETEPLPLDFQNYQLVTSTPDQMEPGFTLCIACFEDSYTCFIDQTAQVRGYLSHRRMAHGTSIIALAGGHWLATGDEYRQIPYTMSSLWEFNWLGKVFAEYEVPNAIHHGISQLPNGDILAVSNDTNMIDKGTREDMAIVINRQSGTVSREYDFRKILDETRAPYTHFHPDIRNAPNLDWMHMNSAKFDSEGNNLIVSSPLQSMVVSISAASAQINWILAAPQGFDGTSARLVPYLLRPVGAEFEWSWGQHDPEIVGRDSAGRLLLLVFDNGQSRSFTQAGAIPPEKNYSRAVIYAIDEVQKTVSQVWQYGKSRGDDYSTFLGDADLLPLTQNRLVTFGGQLRVNGKPTDNIVAGVLGQEEVRSRLVEVTPNGKEVFEVAVTGNARSRTAETYQAERIYPVREGDFSQLGASPGRRSGRTYFNAEAKDIKAPPFFFGSIEASFNDLHREGSRLIVDGQTSLAGKTYLLGRAFLVFRSSGSTRVFTTTSGLNGRFFASLDLASLPVGRWTLSLLAALREGNDALTGNTITGYLDMNQQVTVERP